MRITKLSIAKILLSSFAFLTVGCSDDDTNQNEKPVDPTKKTSYFVGIEAATDPATEVLVDVDDLTSGTISPENNGYKQPGWMFYMASGNKIITADYSSTRSLNSYIFKDGKLTKGGSFSTNLQVFPKTFVDSKTMVLVGSEGRGLNKQEIYIADIETMAITKTVKVELENNEATNTSAMPNGVLVKGNKLFISFINRKVNDPRSSVYPAGNIAKIAVYNYPELTLDKIITDSRCPNVGRYASSTSLQEDENGNIYTYAPSSILSGYSPIPDTHSGVLRIKNGTTEFDKDFHIDFEEISNGYKINDLYYVANGKAVVRVVKEDANSTPFGAYMATTETSKASVYTGILDLNTKTFTLLTEVAVSGGSFTSPVLVEGTKAYIGVSTKDYANIYTIDTEAGTAKKGVEIKGNYAKAILKVTE